MSEPNFTAAQRAVAVEHVEWLSEKERAAMSGDQWTPEQIAKFDRAAKPLQFNTTQERRSE
jgi:hypothetical protein